MRLVKDENFRWLTVLSGQLQCCVKALTASAHGAVERQD